MVVNTACQYHISFDLKAQLNCALTHFVSLLISGIIGEHQVQETWILRRTFDGFCSQVVLSATSSYWEKALNLKDFELIGGISNLADISKFVPTWNIIHFSSPYCIFLAGCYWLLYSYHFIYTRPVLSVGFHFSDEMITVMEYNENDYGNWFYLLIYCREMLIILIKNEHRDYVQMFY